MAYYMRISHWSSDVCSSDLYFSVLGVFLPYWSVYLKALGFDAIDIGILLALPQLTKIIAPGLWGALADITRRHRAVPLLGAVCRSEERRVGKVCVSPCSSRWSPFHQNKNKICY